MAVIAICSLTAPHGRFATTFARDLRMHATSESPPQLLHAWSCFFAVLLRSQDKRLALRVDTLSNDYTKAFSSLDTVQPKHDERMGALSRRSRIWLHVKVQTLACVFHQLSSRLRTKVATDRSPQRSKQPTHDDKR